MSDKKNAPKESEKPSKVAPVSTAVTPGGVEHPVYRLDQGQSLPAQKSDK